MSAPETSQPCQAGPARRGSTGLGANWQQGDPRPAGGLQGSLSVAPAPQSGDSAAQVQNSSLDLRGSPGVSQGVLGAKQVQCR